MKEPDSNVQHFFVDPDTINSNITEEVGSLDPNVTEVNSIIRFLMLPTITKRSNPQNKDPILDFTMSKILISLEYNTIAQRLKEAKENKER